MNIVTKEQFLEERERLANMSHLTSDVDEVVLDIIQTVRREGDAALQAYTAQFDGVTLDRLEMTEEEMQEAMFALDPNVLAALELAHEQIDQYHRLQKEKSWFEEVRPGVTLGQKVTPIDRVGIYVPGGKAVYPSTVLMNVLPAKIAGVRHIAIVTPPQKDGTINPAIVAAAKLAGVDTIYKVGGAQAIAALAYGTETIAKVDKITGPGNMFVARAKKWVYGDVAIDMIAGPSEICVLADETTNPTFAAADLLSQAEHDEMANAICVTTSESFAREVSREVEEQLGQLPREEIARASIEQFGRIVLVETLEEAHDVVNRIAPEHLEIMTNDPVHSMMNIRHAGAMFLGNYGCEAMGDYVAGPNHTLPTSGTAAFASPLGVYDFMKKSSIIHYTEEAFMKEADAVVTIATAEQLSAHAKSVEVRKGTR
ncbi:histidinol dehydrogenase [Planococcaceae bacterium Storch 2/2-2]|nr:histidinol dehydrogenase [Planococcaceae bacterium Storch 2/2-2]